MIRVHLAPEPESFDRRVRQPGLAAIAELVGESAPRRTGPKREKKAERREDLSSKLFPPYWQRALDDLLVAYGRVCAYSSLYIHPVTGASSTDHMVAKSRAWQDVYEWRNYRLACSRMNARKGALMCALDPFEIADDWFALELVGYQVVPGAGARGAVRTLVEETIDRHLRLNDAESRRARSAYAEDYLEGHISFARLSKHAPFLARELARQGRLRPADGST